MAYDPLGDNRVAKITTNNGRRMFYEVGRAPYEGDCVQHWYLSIGQRHVLDTSNAHDLPWMELLVQRWNDGEVNDER